MRLYQAETYNATPLVTLGIERYPDIPNATEFQHNLQRETPVTVHGWQWSVDFGKWSALVTFADGWHGFTYPVTW